MRRKYQAGEGLCAGLMREVDMDGTDEDEGEEKVKMMRR